MRLKTLVACLVLLLTLMFSVQAFAEEGAVSRQELDRLRARLDQLEEQMKEAPERADLAPELADLLSRLSFSGVIEVEAGYADTDSDDPDVDGHESDIVLATMELGIEVAITDWITGEVVLLWEEDDTEPVDLDVATITIGNTERFPLYVVMGKMYPPFGNFESNFLTDPVVVEIGETRESAVRLGAVFGPLDVSVTTFNGDISEGGDDDDDIDNLVAAISLNHEWDDFSLGIGASYTTNIADSEGLTGLLDEVAGTNDVRDYVGGFNLWTTVGIGPVTVLGEYVGATDDFAVGELNADEKAKPQAWNFEAAFSVTDALTIAARYETADDVFGWQPEDRYGVCASYLLHEGKWTSSTVSLEYLHGEFDNGDKADSVTLQFAIEF